MPRLPRDKASDGVPQEPDQVRPSLVPACQHVAPACAPLPADTAVLSGLLKMFYKSMQLFSGLLAPDAINLHLPRRPDLHASDCKVKPHQLSSAFLHHFLPQTHHLGGQHHCRPQFAPQLAAQRRRSTLYLREPRHDATHANGSIQLGAYIVG